MTLLTVREHARLTTGPVPAGSLDVASVTESAFDWLCQESQRLRAAGASLLQIEGRRWLRLDNYVGVLETPCGTRIEILPKCTENESDVASARAVLLRMLKAALRLPVRESSPTAIQTFQGPVSEWIVHQFLVELRELIRRGIRFDYHLVEAELRFLRGRLLVSRQVRQPAGRQHVFQVEHQVFDANRPENRLIATALRKISRLTRDPDNWRLAHEFEHQLQEVESSTEVAGDFRRWSDERLMALYRSIRPWCELILSDRNPMSMLGQWTGKSLLFPMERVFECYVEACLRRMLPRGAVLRAQAAGRYLCKQGSRQMFQLRPDFIIEYEGATWVVDAKWKLIRSEDREDNYGLAQSDFYQLFAYGKRYLRGAGQLVLVFPGWDGLRAPLETFDLEDGLRLDAIPLDLEAGQLVSAHLPS